MDHVKPGTVAGAHYNGFDAGAGETSATYTLCTAVPLQRCVILSYTHSSSCVSQNERSILFFFASIAERSHFHVESETIASRLRVGTYIAVAVAR